MITVHVPEWETMTLITGYETFASYTKKSCRSLINSLLLPDEKVNILVIGDTHIGSTIVDLATHFEDSVRVHVAYNERPYLGYALTQKWLIPVEQENVLQWVLGQNIKQWCCCVNSFNESRSVKTQFIEWSRNDRNNGRIFIFPLQM